jgi:tetratricopeptide (TPR) repeat protein
MINLIFMAMRSYFGCFFSLMVMFGTASCQHNSAGNKQEAKQRDNRNEFTALVSAVNRYPDSLGLRLQLADAYQNKKQLKAALRELDTILQRDSSYLNALYKKADLHLELKDTAAGIATLEQVKKISQEEEIMYGLAYLYAGQKNSSCLAICDTMIARMPKNNPIGDPYFIKGLYFRNINNNGEALRQFTASIRTDYTFMEAYTEKGKIYLDQKNYTEALKTFELSTRVSNSFAAGYYWQGKCKEAMGKPAEAIPQYQKALGLDPEFTEARKALQKLNQKS